MRRLIAWLIGAPLALIAILLSVANRGTVTFSLDPISLDEPALAVDVPLFALLFAAVFLGLVIGWVVGWSGALSRRRAPHRTGQPSASRPSTAGAAGRALVSRP